MKSFKAIHGLPPQYISVSNMQVFYHTGCQIFLYCCSQIKEWSSLCCCLSEWTWNERARQLSNRQKDYLMGLIITFFYKMQGIVVMCEWKIQDAQWRRKELRLCANGRFRMRRGVQCDPGTNAIWIMALDADEAHMCLLLPLITAFK